MKLRGRGASKTEAASRPIREASRPYPAMRSPRVLPIVLLLALLAPPRPHAEPGEAGWRVLGSQSGVEVAIRDHRGRTLPEFRGIGEVEAPLHEVLAVVYDVDRHSEWVHDTIESKLLGYDSFLEGYMYHRIQVQWPFNDRDAVMRTETRIVEPGAHLRVEFAQVTKPAVPARPGIVRMPSIAGHYDMVALGPSRTRVEYRVDADPGLNVPAWLGARTATAMPLYTILNLRRQVARTHGEYDEFVALWKTGRPDEGAAAEYARRRTAGS
jgi:hypothetical protein